MESVFESLWTKLPLFLANIVIEMLEKEGKGYLAVPAYGGSLAEAGRAARASSALEDASDNSQHKVKGRRVNKRGCIPGQNATDTHLANILSSAAFADDLLCPTNTIQDLKAERGRDRERQGVTSMYNKWQQHSPPGPLTLRQQLGHRARANETSNVTLYGTAIYSQVSEPNLRQINLRATDMQRWLSNPKQCVSTGRKHIQSFKLTPSCVTQQTKSHTEGHNSQPREATPPTECTFYYSRAGSKDLEQLSRPSSQTTWLKVGLVRGTFLLQPSCPQRQETLKHHCLYCAVAPTALHLVGGHGLDDIGVTSVGDGHHGHAEVATAGRAQLDVVAAVVVHAGLGQHSVVLQLGLPHRRNVVGHNQELGCRQGQEAHAAGGATARAHVQVVIVKCTTKTASA
eukprot:1161244-Pelagomonas_calceolata.AAC.2